MAKINWSSIHSKTNSALKNNGRLKNKKKEYAEYLGSACAKNAAIAFRGILLNEINSNPLIDVAGWEALRHISFTEPYLSGSWAGNPIYTVEINFDGDMHRKSLAPEYYSEGINNIAALINNGYRASHIISGVWDGHMDTAGALGESRETIPSLKERPGAQFAQNAVRAFSSSSSATANHVISVRMNDIYN